MLSIKQATSVTTVSIVNTAQIVRCVCSVFCCVINQCCLLISSFVSDIYTSPELLNIWPWLCTSQGCLIRSHQIFLTTLFLKVRTLKEVLHRLWCATVAVNVVIICICLLIWQAMTKRFSTAIIQIHSVPAPWTGSGCHISSDTTLIAATVGHVVSGIQQSGLSAERARARRAWK